MSDRRTDPAARAATLAVTLLLAPALANAAVVEQNFASDPKAQGWAVVGDPSLFQWLPAAGALAVTWDSSHPNSFYHLPLGTSLTRDDDFAFEFDIRIADIAAGTTPGKIWSFEIAAGFLNLARASTPGFCRGTGYDSPDLVEWDYFPGSSTSATVAASITSSSGAWARDGFSFPHSLDTEVTYHFRLEYRADIRTLMITEAVDGQTTPLAPAWLGTDFDDFAVDAFAVSSYSDAGQDPAFGGSVVAHGTVDNLRLELPNPPIRRFAGSPTAEGWTARFTGWVGWDYTLERTTDFRSWQPTAPAVAGTGLRQTLLDPSPLANRAFYRLRASRQ
jgi:hypothetical protein